MGKTFSTGLLTNGVFQDASNNIGIGAAPSGTYKLEVTGTAKVSSTLLVSGAATFSSTIAATSATFSSNVRINAASSGTNKLIFGLPSTDYYWLEYNDATGNIGYSSKYNQIFYGGAAGTTPLVTILNGGNVGIGISDDNPIGNGGTYRNLLVGNGAGYGVFQGVSTATATGSTIVAFSGGTTGASSSKNAGSINLQLDGTSTTNAIGRWLFYTSDGTNFAERMRITSGGKVTIGSTSLAGDDLFNVTNSSSTGYGASIQGGSSSGNYSFVVRRYDGTEYFKVRGDGAVSVAGSLSKGSGSFRIEHPLESLSETHQLVHSFIEGPQADLIYRGKLTLVNGKAQANIDEVSTMTEGTFEALCREVQCFTTNESGWDLVKGKVIGNIIYIESQNPNSTDEISWMVIGERKDKHMMDTEWTDNNGKVIVEPLKPIEPTIQSLQEQNQDLKSRLDKAGL